MVDAFLGIIDLSVLLALDRRPLGHRREAAVVVNAADAAGDAAEIGEGVLQEIAHKGVPAPHPFDTAEKIRDGGKAFPAIEVIGIDHGKRLMDHVFGHHHGMVRPPGFFAALRHGIAFRQAIQFLIDKFHVDFTAKAFLRINLLESLGKRVTDDKDHLAETGLDGIVDRVVDDGLAARAETVHLLEGAVAGTHPGSQN